MGIECLVLGNYRPLLVNLNSCFEFNPDRYTCMFVLGAGQEVGKSCVVVSINGKRIMFDCGMHMGYDDHRRYPDFSLISKSKDFNNSLHCIVITHLYVNYEV